MAENKYVVEGDVCKIEVIQRNGKGHWVLINTSDMFVLDDWNGISVHPVGNKFYVRLSHKGVRKYLHRVILNNPEGLDVDHINGVPTDNRRNNLRVVTHQQNQENRVRLDKNNTSGVRGVTWDKSRNSWQAKVEFKTKVHHLGRFKDLKDAAEAVSEFRRNNMLFSEMDKAA